MSAFKGQRYEGVGSAICFKSLPLPLIPSRQGRGKVLRKTVCVRSARRPPLNLAYLDRTKDIQWIFWGYGVDKIFLGIILFIVNIR